MKCLRCGHTVEYSSRSRFYCIACYRLVWKDYVKREDAEFMYRKPIEELDLERSIRNHLVKNGVEYIDQLTDMTFGDLLRMKRLSPSRARIIRLALRKNGYNLSTEE